jgi:hypothetical protein
MKKDEEKKRLEKVRRVFRKIIDDSAGNTRHAHVSQLMTQIEEKLGGVDKFAADLAKDLQAARKLHPGSKTVLDFDAKVVDFYTVATRMQDTSPDTNDLSDEELGAEVLKLVAIQMERENIDDPMNMAMEMIGGADKMIEAPEKKRISRAEIKKREEKVWAERLRKIQRPEPDAEIVEDDPPRDRLDAMQWYPEPPKETVSEEDQTA